MKNLVVVPHLTAVNRFRFVDDFDQLCLIFMSYLEKKSLKFKLRALPIVVCVCTRICVYVFNGKNLNWLCSSACATFIEHA